MKALWNLRRHIPIVLLGIICIFSMIAVTMCQDDEDLPTFSATSGKGEGTYAAKPVALTWDFSKGLDGWSRVGKAPSWKTLSDSVVWYQSWGDGSGVVVMDSCVKNPSESASTGIEKKVHIPYNANTLFADVLKEEEDGAVEFKIWDDSTGVYHKLGTVHLSGRQKKYVEYDITQWSGQDVVLSIKSVGWGNGATASCSEEINTCCGEFVGLDKIVIS
jgi:hypothetical protein